MSDGQSAKPWGGRYVERPLGGDGVAWFIPSLAAILQALETQKGTPLTDAEALRARDTASCIVIDKAHVEVLAKKRGYPDVDPANVLASFRALMCPAPPPVVASPQHQQCLDAFDAVFGGPPTELYPNRSWSDGLDDEIPPMAVAHYPTDAGQVLVTIGMSCRSLTFPSRYTGRPFRTELILYVSEVRDEHIDILLWLAAYPHLDSTVLGFGHTVQGDEPMFEGSQLRHALMLEPLDSQHRVDELLVDGEPVHVLWLVPLTHGELELKKERGVDALLDLFSAADLPVVLNETRASLVAG